ncbi:hypothetical protein [uncultured Tenacibaculum sp.]|uniref:hypothetical protein n=1 Tax=uncultured Tenacibaculum sp. TaxID=174713 RepID=UPI002615202F|nr:hypothetical protein [uncultured Tenacibaculum sp.]
MTGKLLQKTQTTTEKVKKYSVGLIAVIFLLIGITASFTHKLFLPAGENPKILQLNKERSLLKKSWNSKEKNHDSLFINNLISKNEYFQIKTSNKKQRILDFRNIGKKRREYAIEYSFNGRNSFHYWLWVFGISLTLFIVSCFLAFKDARLHKEGLLKWYEPKAVISFIAISLFWLFHAVFKTSYDFELSTYLFFLLAVIFPLSYFIYHFMRRLYSIEENLLENIRNLVSHVLKNTKEEKENEKWELLDKISRNGK